METQGIHCCCCGINFWGAIKGDKDSGGQIWTGTSSSHAPVFLKPMINTVAITVCLFVCVSVCVPFREGEDTVPLLSDPRISLLTNGTIELTNVSHDDSGTYTCSVKHTNISIIAHLEVFSESHTHSAAHEYRAGRMEHYTITNITE